MYFTETRFSGFLLTLLGKPGKMRVHLENLEIWNFLKNLIKSRKIILNLENLGGH